MTSAMPTSASTLAPPEIGYTTRELQAAAAALAAGHFIIDGPRRPSTRPSTRPGASTWQPDGPLVRVSAAQAGAGASTLALALADAFSQAVAVRLLDAAAPAWSGLVGATRTELGGRAGWRRGRRGALLVIDRLEEHAPTPSDVPVPRDHEPVVVTVLDVGWSRRELDAHPHGWLHTIEPAVEVVVTGASVAAFGHVEAALAHTDLDACVVAVIGANRWSGPGFASAGHRMRQLRDRDAIAFVSRLGARTLTGLGPEPLPRSLMSSAQRLRDRLTTITGPLVADRTHLKDKS